MLGLSSNNVMSGGIAGGKTGIARKHQALLCLLGLTIFLRIMQEIRLSSWLDQEEETQNSALMRCEGGLELDESSPQCLEVQLFRSWRHVESDGPEFSETVEDLERRAQQKLVEHRQAVPVAPQSSAQQEGPSISTALAGDASTLGAAEKIDSIYNHTMEVLNNHSSITPYAQKLMDVEARMARLPGAKQRQHQQWEEEFDKLEKATLESIHSRNTHAYADKLTHMMEDFDARQANLPSAKKARALARQARMDKLFEETSASIHDHSHDNDYANHLQDMRNKLEALNARHPSATHAHAHPDHSQELASHNAALNGHVKEMEHDHEVWQEAFSTTASDYLTHLCEEEPRRSYPVCSKFLASQGSKGSKAGAPFASEAGAGTTTLAPKSGFLAPASVDDRLSWTGLLSSLKGPATGSSKGLVAVERKQLLSQKWQGRLPTVACVVAIDSGSQASMQLKHVVKNFRLQSYEGQRQLLILYPAADKEVEELVNEHSDGTFIKGVPARSHGAFPSTTSLRFAAWSTEADIIALWEFDEWYHPDRLAMQVRALAVTSRPVSLLKRWTVLGSESASSGTVLSDELGWENSIVGEAGWMKAHWMPLLHNQREILGGVQAHSIVQVDMPELSVYLMSDAGSWQGALGHFGLTNHTATASEMPEACLQAFAAGSKASKSSMKEKWVIESNIVDEVGAELAKKYHALITKQADIGEKLRSLCEEVRAETEPLQRDMMVGQVEKMADVQRQLAEHFETVKASF
jgi:hypothetical protein